MRTMTKKEDIIHDVIPWATSNYLENVMQERKKEIKEVLEIIDSLSLSEIPEDVRGIIKRPEWERLLV
jgi:hypothetical protein